VPRQNARFRPPKIPPKPASKRKKPRILSGAGAFLRWISALALRRVRSSARRAAALHYARFDSLAAWSYSALQAQKSWQRSPRARSYHRRCANQADGIERGSFPCNFPAAYVAAPRPRARAFTNPAATSNKLKPRAGSGSGLSRAALAVSYRNRSAGSRSCPRGSPLLALC